MERNFAGCSKRLVSTLIVCEEYTMTWVLASTLRLHTKHPKCDHNSHMHS